MISPCEKANWSIAKFGFTLPAHSCVVRRSRDHWQQGLIIIANSIDYPQRRKAVSKSFGQPVMSRGCYIIIVLYFIYIINVGRLGQAVGVVCHQRRMPIWQIIIFLLSFSVGSYTWPQWTKHMMKRVSYLGGGQIGNASSIALNQITATLGYMNCKCRYELEQISQWSLKPDRVRTSLE